MKWEFVNQIDLLDSEGEIIVTAEKLSFVVHSQFRKALGMDAVALDFDGPKG